VESARILVVDDESRNVEILLRCLARKGHAGVGAENAEEAARLLSDGAFDLVLLDHVLPGATGMQSLPRLRALTRAPIHIMSGYSDDDTRRDAELLGAAGFLAKPIDVEALLAMIAALPERPA
jgi:DNA-binding response OmpR family regulator